MIEACPILWAQQWCVWNCRLSESLWLTPNLSAVPHLCLVAQLLCTSLNISGRRLDRILRIISTTCTLSVTMSNLYQHLMALYWTYNISNISNNIYQITYLVYYKKTLTKYNIIRARSVVCYYIRWIGGYWCLEIESSMRQMQSWRN